jgi:hypothetical protein
MTTATCSTGSRAFYKFSRVGAVDGGDLEMKSSAAQKILFTAGPGEDGTDAGMDLAVTDKKLTLGDTNADVEGALVDDPDKWITQAVGVIFEPAFVTTGSEFKYVVWTRSYQERLWAALANNLRMFVQHGSSSQEYDLGPVLYLGQNGIGAKVGQIAAQGNPMGPGAIMPFRMEDVSTGQKTKNKLRVTMLADRDLLVENDAAEQTDDDVILPVRVLVFGYPQRNR